MPYKPWERKAASKRKIAKTEEMAKKLCGYCKVNRVIQLSQLPKPCEPCYSHIRFDTTFASEACFTCGEPAKEFWTESVSYLHRPYCGTCRHVHQYQYPETWEAWPWHEPRGALWAPGGPVERLASSRYRFVLLRPFSLLEHGWRAKITDRKDSETVLDTIAIPATDDHFQLWPMVLRWIDERESRG